MRKNIEGQEILVVSIVNSKSGFQIWMELYDLAEVEILWFMLLTNAVKWHQQNSINFKILVVIYSIDGILKYYRL